VNAQADANFFGRRDDFAKKARHVFAQPGTIDLLVALQLAPQARYIVAVVSTRQRLLDQAALSDSNRRREVGLKRAIATVQQGTILSREWNGRMHRVSVLTDGFAWNGNTYRSLSKVAFAITGTRWNGPRFFGLRDRSPLRRSEADP
jgi:hypothetical protein